VDYEETPLLLDSILATWVFVYPVSDPRQSDEPWVYGGGDFHIEGVLRRQPHKELSAARYATIMGCDPQMLEIYKRNVAFFTFDGMDDEERGFAGFSLWRHDFIESSWEDFPGTASWLRLRMKEPADLIIRGEFTEGTTS
jgi:hypothetical protein